LNSPKGEFHKNKPSLKVNKLCEIEIFDDEFEEVAFYTIRIEDEVLTETEKFYQRFLENENYADYSADFRSIVTWIELIGNEFGALEYFFRPENSAYALPPKERITRRYTMGKNIDIIERNRLRLYCIWISESVVILLNGGIKEAQKNSDKGAENIQSHFRLANKIGKIILEKIIEDELSHSFKNLEGDFTFYI